NVFLTFLFQPISPDSLFCSSCQYIFGRIYFWCAFILQPASSLVRISNLRIIRHITFTHFHGKRTTCSEWTSFWRIFRSEEHTSELQSRFDLVCRLLLEKKNKIT